MFRRLFAAALALLITGIGSTALATPTSINALFEEQAEMRGIWVTRWTWRSEEEVVRIVDRVADAGFNTIFFQVRGTFDSYYRSNIEPWGERLTGTLGQDPGWDPLAVTLREAHQRGLKVHVWLNTFPIWRGHELPSASTPTHPLTLNPDWVLMEPTGERMPLNDSYIFADPANPEVRAHVAAVVRDIVANYAVDGVHLDYIRYPGKDYIDRERGQAAVTATVAEVRRTTDLPLSAAVWGIHSNPFGWSGVSKGATDYYQESHAWGREGALDAIAPMIYWPVTEPEGQRLDFRSLVRHHIAERGQAAVWAGVSAEHSYEEVVECVRAAREEGAQGYVIFDYSQLEPNVERFGVEVNGR